MRTFSIQAVPDAILNAVVSAVEDGVKKAKKSGGVQRLELTKKGYRQDLVFGELFVIPPSVCGSAKDFPSILLKSSLVHGLSAEEAVEFKFATQDGNAKLHAEVLKRAKNLFKNKEGKDTCLLAFAPTWGHYSSFRTFPYEPETVTAVLQNLVFAAPVNPALSSVFDQIKARDEDFPLKVVNVPHEQHVFNFASENVDQPDLNKGDDEGKTKKASMVRSKLRLTAASAEDAKADLISKDERAVLDALDASIAKGVKGMTPLKETKRSSDRYQAKTASGSDTVYEANKQVDVPGFGKLQVYIRLWYDTPSECGGAIYLDCAPLANGGPQDSDYFVEIPNTNKSKVVRGRRRISDYGWDEISDLLGMENLLAKVPDQLPIETIAGWYKEQTGGELLNSLQKPLGLEASSAKMASSSDTVYEADKQVDVPGFGKLQAYIRLWYDTPSECGGAIYLDCAPLANGSTHDSNYFVEIPNTNKSKVVRGGNIRDYGWDEISDLLGMENLLAKVPDQVPVETIAGWYKDQTGGELLNSLQKPLGLEASLVAALLHVAGSGVDNIDKEAALPGETNPNTGRAVPQPVQNPTAPSNTPPTPPTPSKPGQQPQTPQVPQQGQQKPGVAPAEEEKTSSAKVAGNRAFIGRWTGNLRDAIRLIYVHWAPKYSTLVRSYGNDAAAKALIDLGDLSSVGATLEESQAQSYRAKGEHVPYRSCRPTFDYKSGINSTGEPILAVWVTSENKWMTKPELEMFIEDGGAEAKADAVVYHEASMPLSGVAATGEEKFAARKFKDYDSFVDSDGFCEDLGSAFDLWMSEPQKKKMWALYQSGHKFISKVFDFDGDKDDFWTKVDAWKKRMAMKGYEDFDDEENGDQHEFILVSTAGKQASEVSKRASELDDEEFDDEEFDDEEFDDEEFDDEAPRKPLYFRVTNYGSTAVIKLQLEDGRWRESLYSAEEGDPSNLQIGNSTYMSYLTPQDLLSWLKRDYQRVEMLDGAPPKRRR
jgi:hypothetical protein